MAAKARLFLSTALLLSIGGCATTQGPAKLVDLRPAKLTDQPTAQPDEALYQAAVTAMERRDYALALDALQAARSRSPDDARVWNAMGVVYDKLGRFDLSARYYAQAQELDPGSKVVSQNLAYSAVLQGKQAEPRASAAVDAHPVAKAAAPAGPVIPSAAIAHAEPVPQVTRASAPASTIVQVQEHERAPRLASVTETLSRWAAPVVEAFTEPTDTAQAPVRVETPARQAAIRPAVQTVALTETPPAAAPRVTGLAAPARQVARVSEQERAPRFARAANSLRRWEPAALTSPAEPARTEFPPEPAIASASRAPLIPTATPPAAPAVTMAKITPPAAPSRTVPRPHEADRTLRLAAITEPLLRLAGPAMNAPTPPATPAAAGRRSAPRATTSMRVAAPAPQARLGPQPIRLAVATGQIKLARVSTPVGALLGRPLRVVNASGRRGGAEPVRLKLASRGWTAPISVVRPGNLRASSTIRYAARNVMVARALARTLPYRVRLESCASSCRGVTLFVGADALRWNGSRVRGPSGQGRA